MKNMEDELVYIEVDEKGLLFAIITGAFIPHTNYAIKGDIMMNFKDKYPQLWDQNELGKAMVNKGLEMNCNLHLNKQVTTDMPALVFYYEPKNPFHKTDEKIIIGQAKSNPDNNVQTA